MQTGRPEHGGSGKQNRSRQTVDLLESMLSADMLSGDIKSINHKSNKDVTKLQNSNGTDNVESTSTGVSSRLSGMGKLAKVAERTTGPSRVPSSDAAQPFDEPRSKKDRRASQQPYLIPDSGCRRKRDRRVNRSLMRNRPWWMLRSYADKEIR